MEKLEGGEIRESAGGMVNANHPGKVISNHPITRMIKCTEPIRGKSESGCIHGYHLGGGLESCLGWDTKNVQVGLSCEDVLPTENRHDSTDFKSCCYTRVSEGGD